MSEKKEGITNLSRRQFLKDAGLVVGGTAVSSVFLLSACGKEIEVTKTVTTTAPGTTVTKYTCPFDNQEFSSVAALKTHIETQHLGVVVSRFIVNGKTYDLSVESKETLAEVLRYRLNLTGTKVSCDAGICGACTVLIDGKPVSACMVLAVEVEGRNIQTIEGLADGDKLHPVQQAWGEEHGFQCGYCAAGFIMTTKSFLEEKPNPSKDEVKEALAGNICRCGNYENIINAVFNAAEKMRGG